MDRVVCNPSRLDKGMLCNQGRRCETNIPLEPRGLEQLGG